MDRCALFVDASYALADGAMAVHGTRRRDSVSWNHSGLLTLLAGLAKDRTGLPVLRCYWYETTPEGRRTPELDALAEMPGLKLRLISTLPGRREGIEAQLRRDLVTLAKSGGISDAFIASADEHLAEIVADVQDLGLRVVILHISTDGTWTIPQRLRQECDDIVEISGVHLRPFVELVRGAEPAAVEQYASSARPTGYPDANDSGAVSYQRLPVGSLPTASQSYVGVGQLQQVSEQAVAPRGMAQSGVPQAGVPQSVAPQPSVRPSGVPQSGLPQAAVPQSGVPQSGVSQSGVRPSGPPPSGFAQPAAAQPGGMQPGGMQSGSGQMPAGQPGPDLARPVQSDNPSRTTSGQHGGGQYGLGQYVHADQYSRVDYNGDYNGAPHPADGLSRSVEPAVGPGGSGERLTHYPRLRDGGARDRRGHDGRAQDDHADSQIQNGRAQDGRGHNGRAQDRADQVGFGPAEPTSGVYNNGLGQYGSADARYQNGIDLGDMAGDPVGQSNGGNGGAEPPRLPTDNGRQGSLSAAGPTRYEAAPTPGQHHHVYGAHEASPLQGQPGGHAREPGQQLPYGSNPPRHDPAQPSSAPTRYSQEGPGRPGPAEPSPARYGLAVPPSAQHSAEVTQQRSQPPTQYQPTQSQYQPQYQLPQPPAQAGYPDQYSAQAPNLAEAEPRYRPQPHFQPQQYQAQPQYQPQHYQSQQHAYSPHQPGGQPLSGQPQSRPQPTISPTPRPVQPVAVSLPDAVKAAHAEGFTFGESVGRNAPGLWLEAVLARKPRMPSDLEAKLLQGSSLPIDSLLHDEVRHSLRRGFWDALESVRR